MKSSVATERLVLAAAAVGAFASGSSTAISVAQIAGATPPALFLAHAPWSSLVRAGAVPLEFFAFVWFIWIALIYLFRRSRESNRVRILAFLTASPIVGVGLWLALSRPITPVPVVVTVAAAATIMGTLAVVTDVWRSVAPQNESAEQEPRARIGTLSRATVVCVALSAGCAALLQVGVGEVTAEQAFDRDLRRWYISRTVIQRGVPLKIEVFTDYLAADRYSVPARSRQVAEYRRRGLPVEMLVRDFPRDAACNAAGAVVGRGASCEAAYAVRLVRMTEGEPAAEQFADWLYRRGSTLSAELIHGRLDELGLLEEFRRQYETAVDLVAKDIALGQRLGVTTTPTFFAGGLKLPNGRGMLLRVLRFEEERRLNASTP